MKESVQRREAKKFQDFWKGKGYEKGESQKFWLHLLKNVFGIEEPEKFINFEEKVKLDNTSFIDGYIPSTHVMIEQKSLGKSLSKGIRQSDGSIINAFQQAKRYSAELPYSDRPRWIVTSNFEEFCIYDMEQPNGVPEIIKLKNLDKEFYRLNFLVKIEDTNIVKQTEVSLQAGELVGVLYNSLLNEYQDTKNPETLKSLNVLCIRIIFCLYAEDAGLFGSRNMFHDYLYKYKNVGFRDALIKLFDILNQKPEERDPYIESDLANFPYVNGGLFEKKDVVIPRINDEIIDIILNKASANFDWSKISPTIFGGLFESTLNPENRRSGGMHYTSVKNIHKVIDQLFLDELRNEFDLIKDIKVKVTRDKKLRLFQDKLADLKFLDPAAGSGNFLTETYISLRRLENDVLKILYGHQLILADFKNPIKISINQFYGIEINDFAVTVARTALWIAESQMMKETEDILHSSIEFLPLKSYATIIEGNATTIEWSEVVDKDEVDYIIGNPPFIGFTYMSQNQKKDMALIFPKIKNLDYVACWFKIAANYIKGTNIECGFVATSSIAEGETVARLWPEIDITINFAYQRFIWESSALHKASVHCVIIGFADKKNKKKWLFKNNQKVLAKNINSYLVDAPDVLVTSRNEAICNVPKMVYGNKPADGGYLLLNEEEVDKIKKVDFIASKYIKPIVGAREFLNNINRYCLWLVDTPPEDIRKSKQIMQRVQKVKKSRENSKAAGIRKFASKPSRFAQITQPANVDYLLIPRVSSVNRRYVPIGFKDYNTIVSDAVQIVPSAGLYELGILTSNVHMSWMRAVCGRLKSDYRYSKDIVYNNFPWPKLSSENKEKIEKTAQGILYAREKYPNSTFADLYNDLSMPPELRLAHQENDKVVMEAYGFDWKTMSESECVEELMNMYKTLIK